jgi:TonB family protein
VNRLEKKCFVFSVGMHGLLGVIVLASAAFRDRPQEADAPILSMIPANILDKAGVGGGEPVATIRATQPPAQQAPSQPVVQPPVPRPRVEQPAVQLVAEPKPVRHVERQKPEPVEEETHPTLAADNPLPHPSKTRHEHEIHPTFTTAAQSSDRRKPEVRESTSAESSTHSEARRLSQIENSLDHLASGVQSSGAERTVVDVPGIGGGGEVFAGYRDLVRSAYYRAWVAPENGSNKLALPEVQIQVARDGTIISAELIGPSGETALDKSVLRALRGVPKLPPFPAASHDEQKTFRIQFSLDLKEASG